MNHKSARPHPAIKDPTVAFTPTQMVDIKLPRNWPSHVSNIQEQTLSLNSSSVSHQVKRLLSISQNWTDVEVVIKSEPLEILWKKNDCIFARWNLPSVLELKSNLIFRMQIPKDFFKHPHPAMAREGWLQLDLSKLSNIDFAVNLMCGIYQHADFERKPQRNGRWGVSAEMFHEC